MVYPSAQGIPAAIHVKWMIIIMVGASVIRLEATCVLVRATCILHTPAMAVVLIVRCVITGKTHMTGYSTNYTLCVRASMKVLHGVVTTGIVSVYHGSRALWRRLTAVVGSLPVGAQAFHVLNRGERIRGFINCRSLALQGVVDMDRVSVQDKTNVNLEM